MLDTRSGGSANCLRNLIYTISNNKITWIYHHHTKKNANTWYDFFLITKRQINWEYWNESNKVRESFNYNREREREREMVVATTTSQVAKESKIIVIAKPKSNHQ